MADDDEAPPIAGPDPSRVAKAVERTVRSVAPGLRRSVKYGAPTYQGRGDVLTIGVWTDFVSVGFWSGTILAARHSILEGSGRSSRLVKLRSVAEARSEAFRALVRDAAALDATQPAHARSSHRGPR